MNALQEVVSTKLLTSKQVAKAIGVTPRTLSRMVCTGEFPEPIRRNSRWVRWTSTDLDSYLSKLIAR